jgi:hypothetical protein
VALNASDTVSFVSGLFRITLLHGELVIDSGAELGARHQTGWTGLIARTLDLFARLKPEDVLRASKGVMAEMTRDQVAGQRSQ